MGFAAGEAGTVCWNHAKSSTSSTAKVYSINPNCPFIVQHIYEIAEKTPQ
jgi:hypothetical protein